MFEIVHTCTEWWDAPRCGIADYEGVQHLFVSESVDYYGQKDDTFLLSPVDAETFQLALVDWGIWRRWQTAFPQRRTSQQTHPALAEDRARHEELKQLLDARLIVDKTTAIRKAAKYRRRRDPTSSGFSLSPQEVQWGDVEVKG